MNTGTSKAGWGYFLIVSCYCSLILGVGLASMDHIPKGADKPLGSDAFWCVALLICLPVLLAFWMGIQAGIDSAGAKRPEPASGEGP